MGRICFIHSHPFTPSTVDECASMHGIYPKWLWSLWSISRLQRFRAKHISSPRQGLPPAFQSETTQVAHCLAESLNSSGSHEGNPDYIHSAQPCMSVQTGRKGPGETGGCLILRFRGNGIVYRRWINTEASWFCSARDGSTAESFRCWKWSRQFCFAAMTSLSGQTQTSHCCFSITLFFALIVPRQVYSCS